MFKVIHLILHNGFTKAVKFYFRKFFGKGGTFISLKVYARKHPESVAIVCQGKENTIYAENQLDLVYENALRAGREIDTFVVMVKGASCFAYSDLVILDDGHYYCETKDNPIIRQVSDCSDGYVLKQDKKYFCMVDIPRQKQCLKKGVFLSGLFSCNYYHYTFQIIPKLQWIEKVDPDVPILVDRNVEEIPSFACLLSICNVQNRPVVVLEEDVQYSVEELYLVSLQTVLVSKYKDGVVPSVGGCYYRPSTLRYLRDRIIPYASYSSDYPKKIFLGRKYASGRRPFNEEECISCAKEFGFEVVYPELMTFEQQVGLFHNAECIIGGSGAAFTNLIYCSNNVKVVVFSKYHVRFALWQTIVEFIGGKMCFLEENESELPSSQLMHVPFHVDIQKLKTILHGIE